MPFTIHADCIFGMKKACHTNGEPISWDSNNGEASTIRTIFLLQVILWWISCVNRFQILMDGCNNIYIKISWEDFIEFYKCSSSNLLYGHVLVWENFRFYKSFILDICFFAIPWFKKSDVDILSSQDDKMLKKKLPRKCDLHKTDEILF